MSTGGKNGVLLRRYAHPVSYLFFNSRREELLLVRACSSHCTGRSTRRHPAPPVSMPIGHYKQYAVMQPCNLSRRPVCAWNRFPSATISSVHHCPFFLISRREDKSLGCLRHRVPKWSQMGWWEDARGDVRRKQIKREAISGRQKASLEISCASSEKCHTHVGALRTEACSGWIRPGRRWLVAGKPNWWNALPYMVEMRPSKLPAPRWSCVSPTHVPVPGISPVYIIYTNTRWKMLIVNR